jgi:hypothetical protein
MVKWLLWRAGLFLSEIVIGVPISANNHGFLSLKLAATVLDSFV